MLISHQAASSTCVSHLLYINMLTQSDWQFILIKTRLGTREHQLFSRQNNLKNKHKVETMTDNN